MRTPRSKLGKGPVRNPCTSPKNGLDVHPDLPEVKKVQFNEGCKNCLDTPWPSISVMFIGIMLMQSGGHSVIRTSPSPSGAMRHRVLNSDT